jgi:glycerol uptake facilitator-like aquaporin
MIKGGIFGALLTWGSVSTAGDNTVMRAAVNRPAEGVEVGQAFLLEAILTFLLCIVVLETTKYKNTYATHAPIAIGMF